MSADLLLPTVPSFLGSHHHYQLQTEAHCEATVSMVFAASQQPPQAAP
jgi:hypothetical protein